MPLSILDKLASALGHRDETPNVALAQSVAAAADKEAVATLAANLSNKKKDIQSDCIKVLYEIGAINPALIAPHIDIFVGLLNSKNNRLAWGAMTALDVISRVEPDKTAVYLPQIIAAADAGSVITRDHAVGILIKLMAHKKYASDCFALLLEQLMGCPTNQLPMYAEQAAPSIHAEHRASFVHTLSQRLPEIEKDSKRLRVEKVIKKMTR